MSISKGWVGAVNDVIKGRSPGSLALPAPTSLLWSLLQQLPHKQDQAPLYCGSCCSLGGSPSRSTPTSFPRAPMQPSPPQEDQEEEAPLL